MREFKPVLFPSGKTRGWRKPPRYVLWRHGSASLTFSARLKEITEAGSGEDKQTEEEIEQLGVRFLEGFSAEEAQKLQAYVDDVILNSVELEQDETPDDLPEADYWFALGLTVFGVSNAPVQTEDGETDAKSVETFPTEQSVSDVGESVPDVRPVPSEEDGNS